MKRLRIPGAWLLVILLLFSACGSAPPAGTPDEGAGGWQQVYGAENKDIPQTDADGADASVDSGAHGADAQAPLGGLDERLPAYGEY